MRSMSCEFPIINPAPKALRKRFSASSADLRFTIHDGGGRAAGDVLRNFHKGINPGDESHNGRLSAYRQSGQSFNGGKCFIDPPPCSCLKL